MPKPYAVSAKLRPGKQVYSATFYVASGNRKTGSLGTTDRGAADLVAAGLVMLRNCGATHFHDERIPAKVPIEARRLYFETTAPAGAAAFDERDDLPQLASVQAELDKFPADAKEQALIVLLDRERIKGKLQLLNESHAKLKADYDDLKTQYDGLKNSVAGRAAESSKNLPTIAKALELFEKELSVDTSRESVKTHVAIAKRFAAALPSSVNTAIEILPEQITAFIVDEVQRTNPAKPIARRRNLHIRLGRFINWAAKRYQYTSQMKAVTFPERGQLRRERGEIKWHNVAEVEAAIERIKRDDPREQAYWRALVATLAYAGPQLAELAWLRVDDMDFTKNQIWIGPVTDEHNGGAKHALKEGFRDRHISMHEKYLLPRLQKYVELGCQGEFYFFPKLESSRDRKRNGGGHTERWLEDTLSTVLRGHKGGKKRPATAGILPKGMNAATLRHTFGSLCLRSGKTTAEVAALMGNSEPTVREHYARLLGCEVDVDF